MNTPVEILCYVGSAVVLVATVVGPLAVGLWSLGLPKYRFFAPQPVPYRQQQPEEAQV